MFQEGKSCGSCHPSGAENVYLYHTQQAENKGCLLEVVKNSIHSSGDRHTPRQAALSPLTLPGLKIAVLFVLQPGIEPEPPSVGLLSFMLNEA